MFAVVLRGTYRLGVLRVVLAVAGLEQGDVELSAKGQ